jgi:hypothetical protein
MPLSRLENFLKNAEGNILYVNPSDFDATDSIENRGNSLTRPFRTIQRAVIEASRFSYLVGRNNDRIDTTTILVYPGVHYIDNRPGHSITNQNGTAEFKRLSNGSWTTSGATLTEFTENSNFDIFDEDNDLFKYNSVHGGVILPRGTSIVGLDLRKTKIRPMYVPDPQNDSVEATSIFKVTGTCYFTAFTLFDADPQRACYKDTTGRKVAPNFSHHKLTCFEYADGVNEVVLGTEQAGLTDLEMYYYKVTYAYGDTSGRGIPNYPVNNVSDFEPSVDEYRIVGDLRADPIGITSVKAGNGLVPTTTVTVTTLTPHNLFKDTPVLISGITTSVDEYNGSFLVSNINGPNEFQYIAPSTPVVALPSSAQILNARTTVESDSVSSASPYIFSCTLRSVYGMNGMFADGSKATGFKSMLTAQFTGISLQKDDNAFILYDESTGIYNDNLTVDDSERPLHTNSRSIYRPGWENVHIKATNNSIIQCVSVFAIGFARHFVAESGGDMSITNSNSNFGAVSLESVGFRPESFDRDDVGYITHVIPPRELPERETNVTWLPLDVTKIISAAQTERLYISGYESPDVQPPSQIDSYRIGAKEGEQLNLSVIIGAQENNFTAPILMQVPSGIGTSSKKVYKVGRQSGINSITSNIITLESNHQFFNGEKVRVQSDTGNLPSNLSNEKIYYAYTTGLAANQIKLSSTLNDANAGNTITGISNGGGKIEVISYVADKLPGDVGHPIQYDTGVGSWYIQSTSVTLFNTIYTGIVGIGTTFLGNQTGSTFITRRVDNRGLDDRIYKMRYVIPKEFVNARPPTDGFILQETKTTGISSVSLLTSALNDTTQLRNPKIIKDIEYSTGSAFVKTEVPHGLVEGDTVKISKVVSSNDSVESYNGSHKVITVTNPREFVITGFTSSPGTFLNQVNQRSTQQQIEALPTIQREKYRDSLFIYRSQEIKPLIPGAGGQDGIYNIIALCGSISPDSSVGFGLSERNFNQDVRNLYPQVDRDNYDSDPLPTLSHAELSPAGVVKTSDKKDSLTKEALNYFFENTRVGYAITGVSITGTGNTTVTIFTDIDHNLNSIKSLTLLEPGSGYNNSAGVTSTIYSAELINNALDGKNASAKVTISVGNTITSVEIVDAGGSYGVGNTMIISADPAGTPTTYAVVQVSEINNNLGDSIELNGFTDPLLNGTFKIVDIPSSKAISILNEKGLGSVYVSRNDERNPIAYLSDKRVGVSTLRFNKEVGITTVICNEGHGLLPGNTFVLVGTGNTYFSRKFVVDESLGITSFTFSSGITTISQTWNLNNVTVHKSTIAANARALGSGEENLGGRGNFLYAGISTTLSSSITSTDTSIILTSANGFKKGDYVSINAEIMRLSSDPAGSTFTVLRGQFSTVASANASGAVVRKVKVLPVEIRRPSILRASGHTFEYLGYGPGNYSTGLPLKQDRLLSNAEILVSQAREQDGGTVVYTGMNDRGEFFSGATKINGATGEEETIEAPVVTFFGDDLLQGVDKRNSGVFDDIVVKERITIEGGENNNQTSQFYGPVNFSQKVTSSAEDGLETRDFYIKGVASQPKLFTVGIATPTDAKKAGDISFLANPDPSGYIGHVYVDGDWRRWGMISRDKNRDFLKLDQIGVGESTGIYGFTDAVEVNGTVKVRNLYVGGAVTFAGAQAIGNAAFDVINVNNTINFGGVGTNYTILTQNADTIAQFQNLEVTGYAVTFTNPTVRFENSFNSVFPGVSTVAGTLNVNNLTSTTGVITATSVIVSSMNAGRISVSTEAYLTSGIITAIRAQYIGGLGNAGIGETIVQANLNVGIITSITGVACTISTINGTDAFITGVRANTSLATPLAAINTGIITNFKSTNAGISSLYASVGVVTTLVVPSNGYEGSTVDGWMGAPTAYVNTGIITNVTARTIRGTSGADPLTAYINVGVITALTGVGATYQNAQVSSRLLVNGTATGEGIYANIGIISAFGPSASTPAAGSMNINCGTSGDVSARRYTSTVATGTAPLVVASTTKVTNLNADLLDGLDSSSSDTSGNSIVSRSSGGFTAGNVTLLSLTVNKAGSTSSSQILLNGTTNNWMSFNTNGVAAPTFTTRSNGTKIVLYPNVGGSTVDYAFGIASSTLWYSVPNTSSTHKWYGGTTSMMSLSGNNLTVTGEVTANSDERIKTNIKTIENALDKVSQLRGVEYDRTDVELHQIGVIAQEVEKVIPEVVRTNEDGIKSVAYGNLVAVLIESIKDLKGEISELRAELDELKGNK